MRYYTVIMHGEDDHCRFLIFAKSQGNAEYIALALQPTMWVYHASDDDPTTGLGNKPTTEGYHTLYTDVAPFIPFDVRQAKLEKLLK